MGDRGNIHCKPNPNPNPHNRPNLTWKIFAELVKGAGHDSIGCVERFFHAITMVDVDVNVQHALVNLTHV